MNPLMILKGAKWFLILGIVAFGLTMLNGYLKDQRKMRDNLIEATAAKISEQAKNQELTNANVLLNDAIRIQKESLIASREAITKLNQEMTKWQKDAAKQKAVLDQAGRLQSIANRRMDTIQRLSNAATQARFAEFQSVFDGALP